MKRPHQVFPEYSSGSLTKTRYLIGFALQLVSQFKSEGSRRDEHREASVKHLHEVYETLYRGPQHLDDVEVLNLRHHVDLFLRHYTWLRVEAQGRDVKEWNLVSKFHYMRHMAFDCVSLNPSTGSCLADEDFVGHIAVIGTASTRGTSSLKLASKVLQQYYRGLSVRWQGQLRERCS